MGAKFTVAVVLLDVAILALVAYLWGGVSAPSFAPAPTPAPVATSSAPVPPPPAPVVPPAPTTPAPAAATSTSSSHEIVEASNGQTLHVRVGDRVLLRLGDLEWSVDFSNPKILERVKGVALVHDAQGLFTVAAAGTTTVVAGGSPRCEAGIPCPQFHVRFEATVVAVK